jgi:hypothetical protein
MNKWLTMGVTPPELLEEKIAEKVIPVTQLGRPPVRDYYKFCEFLHTKYKDGFCMDDIITHFGHSNSYWRAALFQLRVKVPNIMPTLRFVSTGNGQKGKSGPIRYYHIADDYEEQLHIAGYLHL